MYRAPRSPVANPRRSSRTTCPTRRPPDRSVRATERLSGGGTQPTWTAPVASQTPDSRGRHRTVGYQAQLHARADVEALPDQYAGGSR